METKQLLDDYQKEEFAQIGEHIMHDCAPGNNNWHRRGIIVSDDPTGEMLADVRKALKYNDLAAAGKVHEITTSIDWPMDDLDECYNRLKAEAQKVNHGLLVVWVNWIDLFKNCWCLKQLAKQEDPDLEFKGYVLLVVKFDKWEEVKKYAAEHNKGEFDAMMDCFYQRV